MRAALVIALLLLVSLGQAQEQITVKRAEKLNTAEREYNLVPFRDGVVFCSNRPQKGYVQFYEGKYLEPLVDLYYASYKDNDKLSKPELLSAELNSVMHEGPACFNPTGTQIVFTRTIGSMAREGDKSERNRKFGLFSADYDSTSGTWLEVHAFPHNDRNWNTGHPWLLGDSILLLVSDRPGGEGESDLYECRWKNEQWTAPKNLGPRINSGSKEMFPWVDGEGVLYFASDREGGFGGLDIWMVDLFDPTSEPMVMDSIINTVDDDFALTLAPDGNSGFLSSNRQASDDIFRITIEPPVVASCDSIQPNDYCFRFFERGSMRLDTLPLLYEWTMGDGTKIRDLDANHCYTDPGEYLIELNVIDTITGDVFYNQATFPLYIEEIDYPFIASADTILTGQTLAFDGSQSQVKSFDTQKYFWEMGDINAKGPVFEHTFTQQGQYRVQLTVTGKREASGAYPQMCTYKTITVVDTFTTRIIEFDYESLKTIDIPLVTDPTDDAEFGVPSYSVEIKNSAERMDTSDFFFDPLGSDYHVMEMLMEEDSTFSYRVGDEPSLADIYPVYMDLRKLGYDESTVKKMMIDTVVTMAQLESLSEEQLDQKTLRINNALFESGDWELQPVYREELYKVVNVLFAQENLNILISAHTDNVGDNATNLELSEKRARAVYNYFVSYGIEDDRITYQGFGEKRPIATNDTEAGRRLNRRVEIQIAYQQQSDNIKP